ncbi:hypothetical protein BS47DRAFT_1391676 [Hydnum rufescens UP504]|uniref:Uncharacterized protein n=1 Tax=Hydnum rufescens UP504 TaxID=1448309 RepID=A0A9P6B0C3_9AGAM|nr:hypothetical protein BS47DRAFT_1391676 [Hydnum rufescens UP504]
MTILPTSLVTSLKPSPVMSLVKLSLDEWVTMTVTKTMDPRKRDSFVCEDEPMPLRDVFGQEKPLHRDALLDHHIPNAEVPSNFANSLELYGSFPEYDSIPFAVPQCLPPPPTPTLLLPPTPLLLPSSPFKFQRGHKKNKTHKKSNLKAKLNTYRAYPALRQAIEARESNHHENIELIRTSYYDKRETDLSNLMKILELQPQQLVCSSESLDVERRKLSEKEVDIGRCHRDSLELYAQSSANLCRSQSEKFSCIFTLTADIVSQEEDNTNPFLAFQLHCRFAPHLINLTRAIVMPHMTMSTFSPSTDSIGYYRNIVQDLQLKLFESEWTQLKGERNEYEFADLPWTLPSSPDCEFIKFDSNEDNGW